jgi:hypothetical protein
MPEVPVCRDEDRNAVYRGPCWTVISFLLCTFLKALWRPTFYEYIAGDVLMCIFTLFMTSTHFKTIIFIIPSELHMQLSKFMHK